MNNMKERRLFSVEQIREQVMEAVKTWGSNKPSEATIAGHGPMWFVKAAKTHDEMIVAIDFLLKTEPFNHRLREELNLIKGFANVSRRV